MTQQSKNSYWQQLKIAFQYMVPQLALTRLAGWFAEKQWGAVTHLAIKAFSAKYKINLQEAEKSEANQYASFNEFFIRPLKADARPINADQSAVCFPADGCISELGNIINGQLFQAKGHFFSLSDLLADDKKSAEAFENGKFVTTYLSPRDYHRVHMPCDGVLRKMVYVPGDLFSVNPFLAQHIPNLFARNERVICYFDTPFGAMVQILVGATITASISTVWAGVINPPRSGKVQQWEYPQDGASAVQLKKGEEMGAFRLGSTVINLFQADKIEFLPTLKATSAVNMGQAMTVSAAMQDSAA
ncbi:archaetidylserine decarboxylase [Testudinibacter aquarius]|uniref:Phosphatidylserine decarboxylase proenzyme n=1 Tax=Testudinibacter aquarius TaxID=1524974 RepID=A0A4R3Y9W5_9PAST|nr:archaetidylserine decarboxylase [Testudinibacter aquarius]KAE9525721.1 phosphatidylserine decarboxylase [Testudinibacter aquarius]TCV88716.1 phosphatidylserine decarboxylase [Testudinibacter aquarius]TNG92664.1 phosphatidylserine decarboxylase [Testudinibacter aquarius]